ncbi:MAG TPA: tail fiber protein [Rhodothermales bacterium]|nr:tail fiber protein [Rhodothermales bacterium]
MKNTTLPQENLDAAPASSGFFGRLKEAWRESETYLTPDTPTEAPAHEEIEVRGYSPYVGEIAIFGGNFAPVGWMFCHGQLLDIGEYETLFQLIGTTYGGDGESTFALPDLRGRMPIHQGASGGTTYFIGQSGGTETVTLTANQIPAHTHSMISGVVRGTGTQGAGLTQGTELETLTSPTSSSAGSGQAHENMPPFLGLNFIISLYGVFPSPS